MSWGIDFKADIFISRQDFNKNKLLVEDTIKDCGDEINKAKEYIQMLGASTPKDITPAEQDPLYYINTEIEDRLEEIAELTVRRYQLMLYLEYLNETDKEVS